MRERLRSVSANFFAVPFGLPGLGVVWRTMTERYAAPSTIADGLLALATARGPLNK